MSIVKRSEVDMIRFAGFTDVLICFASCTWKIGGLTKAFADRWPAAAECYKSYCAVDITAIGDLCICSDEKSKNKIIYLITKKDWRDITTLGDVELCCFKLAEYLKEHPFYTVAMPAFGTGPGPLDPVFGEEYIMKYLDHLPNIIHLSMRPDRFVQPPKYLAVVGSRKFTSYDKIEEGINKGLVEFGLTYSDFDAMVSGGAPGVDYVACGTGKPQDLDPNIASKYGLRAIVCRADWERYGNAAGFLRNRTVEDIATHIVAFVGSKSVGTRTLIDLVNRHNAHVDKFLAEQVLSQGPWDIFDRPPLVVPEKKKLHIVDISSTSV